MTLIKAFLNGVVSPVLLTKWEGARRLEALVMGCVIVPNEEVLVDYKLHVARRTFFLIFLTACLVGVLSSLPASHTPPDSKEVIIRGISGCAACFAMLAYAVSLGFTTIEEKKFVSDLFIADCQELGQFINGPAYLGSQMIADTAHAKLIRIATEIVRLEKDGCTMTEQADALRAKFKKHHSICLKFGLAQPTWNPYFTEAESNLSAVASSEGAPKGIEA